MNDFNEQLYCLGIKEVINIYIKNYFEVHGEVLLADGLYSCVMGEVERSLIEETLRRMKGNQVQGAKILGINRNTLRRRIQDLNISLETL